MGQKCNHQSYVDSQYITFSNKTWHSYNCNKKFPLFRSRTINNFILYSWLIDKNYCNSDSNDSCLALKLPKNWSNWLNITFHLILIIHQKYLTPNAIYIYINQLPTLKEFTYQSALSHFHLNTSSCKNCWWYWTP